MELQQRGLATVEVYSETCKSSFIRPFDQPIPDLLYFDKYLCPSEFPASLYYRTICSLTSIPSESNQLAESCLQDSKCLKCFDDSGSTVYLIYYSSDASFQSFLLARYHFSEFCLDPSTFSLELRRLANDRVKDIRFRNTLKDCVGYYKTFFDQWVETVNSQQKEIQKLQEEITEIKAKETKTQEPDPEQVAKCIICEKEQRNVVFVPCGHVVLCTYCLLAKLKLTPNAQVCKKSAKCVVCKRSIKVAHEVYF